MEETESSEAANAIDAVVNSLRRLMKTNKGLLTGLKSTIVSHQEYELASMLRKVERQLWPESEQVTIAKERYETLASLLRMVDINCSPKVAYLFEETLRAYNEKGTEFSLKDAAEIQTNAVNLFGK